MIRSMRWLLALACLTRTALADDAAVAIVDFDRVLAESAPGKQANASLQETRNRKQATLDKKQADLRKLRDGDPAKVTEQAQLVDEYRRLEAELAETRTKLVKDVMTAADPAFAELAGGKAMLLVTPDGLVYKQTTPGDVTTDVIARLAPGAPHLRPATARYRVGIVDVDKLLSTSAAGKRASRDFERLRATKQNQLDTDQSRLQAEIAAIDKEPPGTQAKKREELERKFTELQDKYVRLEKELADARTRLLEELTARAGHVAEEVARKQNLQLVIDAAAITHKRGDVPDLTSEVAAGLD
jgi:Skp family chaperone for outer membrane proteins